MQINQHHKSTIFHATLVGITILLLLSAGFHRYQLESSAEIYRESFIIIIEVICVLSLLVLHLINLIYFLGNLFKAKWRKALVAMLVGIVTLFLLGVSVTLDAPFLLYAT